MARGVHPKKEVRKALKQLRLAGWTVRVAAGGHSHRWGTATCPYDHPDGAGGVKRCLHGIYGTPRSQDGHAKELREALRGCWKALAADKEGSP